MLIKKIISGGQTGADQAGLAIAVEFGISTGGWAPKGWITSEGPNRVLLKSKYNLKECTEAGYPPRTEWNVRDSDGTIRLATNFNSPGEVCTMKGITKYKKPHIDVDLNEPIPPNDVVEWVVWNNIKILNVAGNTQKVSYDVYSVVYEYLSEVLTILARKKK